MIHLLDNNPQEGFLRYNGQEGHWPFPNVYVYMCNNFAEWENAVLLLTYLTFSKIICIWV